MWRDNIQFKVKKSKELHELALLSLRCLEESFDWYYQFDTKKSELWYKLRNKVRDKARSLRDASLLDRNFVKIAEDAADLSHLTYVLRLK